MYFFLGPPLLLTSQTLNVYLNPETFDGMNDYRLSAWLARQEDQHRIVLYLCDKEMSSWTQTCIRQADCILIVCLADAEPTVGKVAIYFSLYSFIFMMILFCFLMSLHFFFFLQKTNMKETSEAHLIKTEMFKCPF